MDNNKNIKQEIENENEKIERFQIIKQDLLILKTQRKLTGLSDKRLEEEYHLSFELDELTTLFFNQYKGLIKKLALKYKKNYTLPFEDLISVGESGLIIALERFDPSKGTKFITYAYTWINQHIMREVQLNGKIINASVRMQERIVKLSKVRSEYFTLNGTEPSIDELMKATGFSKEEIENILFFKEIGIVSLDEKIKDDSDETYVGRIEDSLDIEDSVIKEESINSIIRAINELDYFHKTAIVSYYFEELTLEETGKIINKSKERTRQIVLEARDLVKKIVKDEYKL